MFYAINIDQWFNGINVSCTRSDSHAFESKDEAQAYVDNEIAEDKSPEFIEIGLPQWYDEAPGHIMQEWRRDGTGPVFNIRHWIITDVNPYASISPSISLVTL
ncbi:hypothetical protein CJ179_38515 [Rhodococcus sp. ACS1]|uniref:hypothetical protein n=1 Tax=Rhodococcus sp. ACS1 TaxID=2028570 RepID=UPI000BB15A32|nr:hypothetical protein [Rhodococcus sp. ACS1]PBC38494.1 hypothetical protein CJ179_38515 [Rhodococcus sp. ACS1]